MEKNKNSFWSFFYRDLIIALIIVVSVGLAGRFLIGNKVNKAFYVEKTEQANIQARLIFRAFPVEHGDAFLIQTPEDENIVYDTGHPDFKMTVLTGLAKAGVNKIDHLVLSHSHWDHIGGAPYILDIYPVENIYINGEGYPYETYAKLKESLDSMSDKVNLIHEGDRIELANSYFEILNPEQELTGINIADEEVNNNSIVSMFYYDNEPMILLPGDAGPETIKRLLNDYDLDTQIVIIPHHGDGPIDGNEFFDETTPDHIIVSSNWQESQNLPAEIPADDRLHKTAEEGTVKIVLD